MSHQHVHAFGMHFCVGSFQGGLVTQDSCVVATFTGQQQWGIRNGRPVETITKHVGYIEEILELNYQNHCSTVLLCEWVKSARRP